MRRRLFLFLLAALILIPRTARTAEREFGKTFDVREGKALAQELVSQRPDKDACLRGRLVLRDSDGKRSVVPVTFRIVAGEESWKAIYETEGTLGTAGEKLTIIHAAEQPNQYVYSPPGAASVLESERKSLDGREAATPFSRSEYWLSDFGLEFLHWPEQRLIKDAKITMRANRACKVLESINPNPANGNYRRVVSWIDAENGAPIYVEAYDQENKKLKVFSIHRFRKINGTWQPTELRIQNEKTDAATTLELQLQSE